MGVEPKAPLSPTVRASLARLADIVRVRLDPDDPVAVAPGLFWWPLPVLVEYGLGGWRSGCRTPDQVRTVAREVTAARTLRLAGFAGYEGVLWPLSAGERSPPVDSYLDDAVDIVRTLDSEGLLGAGAIVSFGGSDLYPAVVERVRNALPREEFRVVLRSGCYLVHDHGKYEQAQAEVAAGITKPRFEPALEVCCPPRSPVMMFA